jgi:carbamoyl-phosphate synthase large subunit
MSALVRALAEGARRLEATATHPGPVAEADPGARAVLVTGADGPVGAALAGELAHRGFTVHAAHTRPGVAAEAGTGLTWHLVPRSSDPGYLPTLHRIVRLHGVTIVIPTLDEELPVIASVRRWPDPGVLVVVSGPGPVGLAQDKLLANWQLSGHAVATPACASPSDFADTRSALEALGGAVVVRTRRAGRKSGGARVLFGPDDMDWDRLDDDFVVQQFVPGREYVCVLYRPDGPAKRGAVVFEALRPGPRHEDVRMLAPGEAEDVERTAWAAIRALGIVGPAEVVVRRTADGTATVISVHPRFSRHCKELLDQLSTPETLPRQRHAPDPARPGRAPREGNHHRGPSPHGR